MTTIACWVIYQNPSDYAGLFVARRWEVGPSHITPATSPPACVASSLEGVRAQLPPGLVQFSRHPTDDPCIVEVWV